MTIHTIDTEIQDLQSKQASLEAEETQQAVSGNFSAVAAIKAQLEHIGNRLMALFRDREQAQQQAEIEAKFTEYERLSAVAVSHYTRVIEIDNEVQALQERINALVSEKSDNEAEHHSDKFTRINLGRDLRKIDKQRVQAIDRAHTVEGYL